MTGKGNLTNILKFHLVSVWLVVS